MKKFWRSLSRRFSELLKSDFEVLQDCFRLIMRSRLLLEEDLESLSEISDRAIEKSARLKGPTAYVTLAIAVAAISVASYYSQKIHLLCIIPCVALTPAVIFLCNWLRKSHHKSTLVNQTTQLMSCMKLIQKRNRDIFKMLNRRKNSDLELAMLENFICNSTKHLRDMLSCEIDLILGYKDFLYDFVLMAPGFPISVTGDFEDPGLLQLRTLDMAEIDMAIAAYERIHNTFILVSSSVLLCLGLIFCPYLWEKKQEEFNEMIFMMFPRLLKLSVDSSELVDNSFKCKSFYHLQQKNIDPETRIIPRILESDRLIVDTYASLALINQMMDKCIYVYTIVNEVHDYDLLEKKHQIYEVLKAVREDADCFNQAIATLCEIYAISLKIREPPKTVQPEPSVEPVEEDDGIIRELDELFEGEPEDEEFEAVAGDDAEEVKISDSNYNIEVESSRVAAVLANELKMALKNHARFLASRQKWGIEDEVKEETKPPTSGNENQEVNAAEPMPAPPPSPIDAHPQPAQAGDAASVPLPPLCPPPPPPPLPFFIRKSKLPVRSDKKGSSLSEQLASARSLNKSDEETFEAGGEDSSQ